MGMIIAASAFRQQALSGWAVRLGLLIAVCCLEVFHHPPYSSGPHGGDVLVARDLVPLLEAGGVDLVFCGHDHLHEHSVKAGIHYVTAASAGGYLYPANVSDNPYQIFVESRHHFCLLRVSPQRLVVEAYDLAGEVFDAFSLEGRQR